MPLQKLQFRPGVNRNVSNYTAEGTWWDCNNVRFRSAFPEKIGGWTQLNSTPIEGLCRAIFAWSPGIVAKYFTAIATTKRVVVENSGAVYDLSPFISATTLSAGQLATTLGSTDITITLASHGLNSDDNVLISGATAVGGIPATSINKSHYVDVVSTSVFKIRTDTAAASTATGGGTPTVSVYPHFGGDAVSYTGGWSSGSWGGGGWGVGGVSPSPVRGNTVWSLDNYGDDLIANQAGGPLYYWSYADGTGVRLQTFAAYVAAKSISVAAGWIPLSANYVLTSATSAIVVALGCNQSNTLTTQDPMFVRWSASQNPFDWEPRVDNAAGGIRLSSGARIVHALRYRNDILIFTDTALYSMQYVGGSNVFSVQPLAEGISIAGPTSVSVHMGVVRWMGKDGFYIYDGSVRKIDCPIKAKVFGEFNILQGAQVACGANSEFNEIWWFYPTGNALVPDTYAIYNFAEEAWSFGQMNRSAWLNQTARAHPLGGKYTIGSNVWGRTAYTTTVCVHEDGVDDASSGSPTAFSAYITSADFDISEGHTFSFVSKLIPDIKFDGSTAAAPAVYAALAPRMDPGMEPRSANLNAVTSSQPISTFTPQVDVRVRGRQVNFTVASVDAGVQWKLGTPRIDIRSDGRRA